MREVAASRVSCMGDLPLPPGSRLRILLVEDDPGHALLVQRALRRGGVRNEMEVFEDGQEVLDHLARVGPDGVLVLLDLHLPLVDGFEVLRRLKADATLASTPVLLLTTTEDPEDLSTCRQLGCAHYLIKPIDCVRFGRAVRQLGLLPFIDAEEVDWMLVE